MIDQDQEASLHLEIRSIESMSGATIIEKP